MLTLPYLLLNPDTHLQEKASEILNDKTAIVASGAPPFDDIISPYVSMESGQAPSTQTALTLLQAQLQNEAATDWELSFMMRPYQPQPAEVDGMDGDVEDTTPKKHPSPSITVPEVINPGPRTLFPEVYFSLYADQDIEVSIRLKSYRLPTKTDPSRPYPQPRILLPASSETLLWTL